MTCNKTYLVYKHTSPCGRSYIGRTSNYSERNRRHKNAGSGCVEFKYAINKYGWENFSHKVLFDNLTFVEAQALEEWCINVTHRTLYPHGYNVNKGGRSQLQPPEVLKKIINTRRRNNSEWHSEATRSRISKTLTGKPSPFVGVPKSEEHKRKMSINSGQAKKNEIRGVRFNSLQEAADRYKTTPRTIKRRINSDKHPEYLWVNAINSGVMQ